MAPIDINSLRQLAKVLGVTSHFYHKSEPGRGRCLNRLVGGSQLWVLITCLWVISKVAQIRVQIIACFQIQAT